MDNAVSLVTDNASNFDVFFICLTALYILQAIIQFLRGFLISSISKKLDMRLMLPYYDHIMDMPISDISTRKTGEYLSRFSDAASIRDAVSGATLTLILDSIMVIGCGVILYIENSKLFYISLVIVLLYSAIILLYKNPLKNINREVMENNARVQSYLKESIDGVETIKAYTAEASAKTKNSSKFRRLINSVFKNSVISVSQDAFCDLVELLGIVIILWVGFKMVLANQVTVGSLITFYALLSYFTEPIKNLIGLQPLLQTAIIAAERLNDILDIKLEQADENRQNVFSFDNISISNVDFRYGNHNLVLNDLSLKINKGEKIAIVGESGSGKTTLAKLLLKFYKPESGTITVNGQDLDEISIHTVRNKIAYVDQSTFLFSDTVKNNLLLGNSGVSDEEIINTCKLVKADSFIRKLPLGYDTFLDEGGKNLSGGQKQRIAIARALLRKPELIIFDEATSNLDTITEAAIKETIFKLKNDVTCIVIAHRLSTVKGCDRIAVMDNGTVLEIGSHKELMEKKGKYYSLYRP